MSDGKVFTPKSEKAKRTSISLPSLLVERLKLVAAPKNLSLSALVHQMIRYCLAEMDEAPEAD